MTSISRYIKWIVSTAFLVVVFATVQRGDLLSRLTDVDMLYFTVSFALIPFMIALSCLKWKLLLDHQEQRLPFGLLMRIYMVGYFFTNLLPSTVGGDVVRSYYVGRHVRNHTQAAVSVFVERFSGVLLLLLLGIVAPLLKPSLYTHPAVFLPAGGAAVLLLLTVWIWRIESPLRTADRIATGGFSILRRINRALRLRPLERLAGKTERAHRTFQQALEGFHEKLLVVVRTLGGNRETLFQVVGLTVSFYFMTWVNVYLAFETFHVQPAFVDICAIVPTIMLIFLLPISQGNIGLAEGAYVFYFHLLGYDSASALAMALFMRFKLLCSGAVGYLFYVTYQAFRPDLTEMRQTLEERGARSDVTGPGDIP